MDFEFNEQERMYRDSLREFLKKEYVPIVDKMDAKGPLTRAEAIDVMKKFQQLGIGLDQENARGFVGSPILFGIFAEEVGRVWPSLLTLFGMGALPAIYVPLASDDVKARLIPRLEAAEFIGCFAETEPEAGCDTSKLKTTARPVGDHYVVNGSKTWISNATIADTALVGVTNTETGAQTFLLLDREVSPWEANELHKIGWKASPTGEMFFEDCKVPKENELGVLMGNALKLGPKLRDVLPLSDGFMKLLTTMEPFTAMMTLPRAGNGPGGGGHSPGVLRGRAQLRQGAEAVRQAHRQASTHPGDALRNGRLHRDREAPGIQGGGCHRQGPAGGQEALRHGQGLRRRNVRQGDLQGHADPRRRRPGHRDATGEILPGCPDDDRAGRHQRNDEAGDRLHAAGEGLRGV